MAQKWLVEFTVADTWVADGFDLTDDRALAMLNEDLQFADSNEISARVVKRPDPNVIQGLQNGEIDFVERGEQV